MTGFARGALMASVAFACVSTPAWAQQKQFDVPVQSVASAVAMLGHQAEIQILAPRKVTEGKMSHAVHGAMTVDQALDIMLGGTGTVAKRTGPQTWMVVEETKEIGAATPVAAEDVAAVDIVVTANKRPERLSNVPAPVTALTGASLLQQGATRLEDYAARIPGFTVQNVAVNGGQNQMAIRGITTGVGNPTVGFYIDDAPFGASGGVASGSLTPDIDPADIERVEVLRGPQGTLYGASSMGGLIKFVTRDPSTKAFSGRFEAGLISTDGGSTGYAFRGSVNVPLAPTLALRANAYVREDPGFIDNPTTGAKDINKTRFAGGRASLRWTPDDRTAVTLSATIQHETGNGSAMINVNSLTFQPVAGSLQHAEPPASERLDTTLKLFDARISRDLGWAQLMSETSYGCNDFLSQIDFTPRLGGLVPAFYGRTGGVVVPTTNNLKKFTEEVRLTSPAEQQFYWQVGVFYTRENALAGQDILPIDLTSGAVLPVTPLLVSRIASRYNEIAGFATIGYHLTDRFDISVGGRISSNHQTASEVDSGFLAGAASTVKSHDSVFTFLVNPRYRISDTVMVYGRIASGYRPGGPNLATPGVTPTFGPDRVVNYEIGLKADALDRKLSVDLSAFLIDWNDIQVSEFDPNGLGFFGNAAKARSKGIEASSQFRPIRGLQIDGNITYLDATIAQDLVAPLTIIGKKGDRLPGSARWSGSIGADYDVRLAEGWGLFVGTTWRYTGSRRGTFGSLFSPSTPRPIFPSYAALDLRAGLTFDRWTLSGYVKNVANKIGYVAAFSQGAITSVSITQPRTFGLSLSTRF